MRRQTIFFVSFLYFFAVISFSFFEAKAATVISGVAAQNIIGPGAQIIWTTNVSSDSRVAYGTNGTNFTSFSNSRCDSGGYVTSHCVNLMGLSPSTVYSYKVESMDAAGVDSYLDGFSFTSASGDTNTSSSVPNAPSNFSVSLSASGADATFTWADNSSDENMFKVFKRLEGDTWTYFVSLGANITSFVYPSIPIGTYEYHVSACNTFGCSADSNIVSVSRSSTPDTTAPSVPQNVSAKAVSTSKIDLSWTASTDNVGVSGYNVYRNGAYVTKVTSPSYSDTMLSPSTLYSYVIAAVDSANNFSQASQIATATTFSDVISGGSTLTLDTSPPIISSLETKNIIGPGAQIIWTTDDPSDSKVYYGAAPNLYSLNSTWRCDAGGNVTNHCVNLTGLALGTQYYYQATSKNSAGYEIHSTEQTFFSASSTNSLITTATMTDSVLPTFSATTSTTTDFTALITSSLLPVVFSVKAGSPFCLSGSTAENIFFSSDPAGAGYFTINGGKLSSPQTFISGSQKTLPYGIYTWTAIPKSGYSASGNLSGSLSIPPLDSCSFAPPPAVSSVNSPSPTSTQFLIQPIESIPAEISKPSSYQEAEDFLRQKYQEAEAVFRKENKISSNNIIAEEEKAKMIEEVRTQFPVLAPAADSILLGTTTLSRIAEPEHIVAEVSRVIAERIELSVMTDADADGISDYDEIHIYGTDPKKADTDADDIKDGDEILAGTDPLQKAIAPVPYEDPKEVVLAAKIDSKIFSIQKAEITNIQSASSTETTNRVVFEGTGLPDSFVTLYIFSTPVVVTVKTDSDGKWKYTMDKELENGKHEVYVAMTESAGKILVKSDPIPFVKTAQAVTLSSDFALANTAVESQTGFFRGGTLVTSLIALFTLLGISFMTISFFSKKREPSDEQNH